MEKIKQDYRHYFSESDFLISFFSSIAFLAVSFVINYYAGTYALEKASSSVTDIVLNNIRVYDVDGAFIYGPIIFWSIVTVFLLTNLRRAPFTVKSIALFIVVRSIFVTLTHIGPFPNELPVGLGVTRWFTFGGDLFFSGHAGLPFLLALIFWHEEILRYIFLSCAIFFSAVVLMGHYHYSIDVLAAFFITYTIHDLARHFFSRDYKRFLGANNK